MILMASIMVVKMVKIKVVGNVLYQLYICGTVFSLRWACPFFLAALRIIFNIPF